MIEPRIVRPGLVGSGVGIDLVEVDEVAEALEHFGTRYLERIFTAAEIRSANGGSDHFRLAGMAAAKEATLKALTPADGDAVPLKSIEISELDAGKPTVSLSGASASLAARTGVSQLSVSVSVSAGHALAVVLAEGISRVEPT